MTQEAGAWEVFTLSEELFITQTRNYVSSALGNNLIKSGY